MHTQAQAHRERLADFYAATCLAQKGAQEVADQAEDEAEACELAGDLPGMRFWRDVELRARYNLAIERRVYARFPAARRPAVAVLL